jgi:hypothetical protein
MWGSDMSDDLDDLKRRLVNTEIDVIDLKGQVDFINDDHAERLTETEVKISKLKQKFESVDDAHNLLCQRIYALERYLNVDYEYGGRYIKKRK